MWFEKCTSQFDAGLFATPNTLSYVSRRSIESFALGIVLLQLVFVAAVPVHAAEVSIPVIGRYSTSVIPLYIPAYPKWAHDVVLNATIAWNRAQLWNLQNNPSAAVYTFAEAGNGTATSFVSFSMPAAYASIAVGWTSYTTYTSPFAPSLGASILSTQTYLTPTIFNEAQGSNATAREYAFWLALHELGRVLGLGSVVDGEDVMDCTYTPQRVTQTPQFSTLDLYALQVLAQGSAPNFVTLPNGVQDQFTAATFFLGAAYFSSMNLQLNRTSSYPGT